MTCSHCRQPRTNCQAPDACAVCGCPACVEARAFLTGAEAMRARVLAGIRRWWSNAGKLAGHRFPGHPHWLDCAVAGIDARGLLQALDRGTDGSRPKAPVNGLAHPLLGDPERLSQHQHGSAAGALGSPATDAVDGLVVKPALPAPCLELPVGDGLGEQRVDGKSHET